MPKRKGPDVFSSVPGDPLQQHRENLAEWLKPRRYGGNPVEDDVKRVELEKLADASCSQTVLFDRDDKGNPDLGYCFERQQGGKRAGEITRVSLWAYYCSRWRSRFTKKKKATARQHYHENKMIFLERNSIQYRNQKPLPILYISVAIAENDLRGNDVVDHIMDGLPYKIYVGQWVSRHGYLSMRTSHFNGSIYSKLKDLFDSTSNPHRIFQVAAILCENLYVAQQMEGYLMEMQETIDEGKPDHEKKGIITETCAIKPKWQLEAGAVGARLRKEGYHSIIHIDPFADTFPNWSGIEDVRTRVGPILINPKDIVEIHKGPKPFRNLTRIQDFDGLGPEPESYKIQFNSRRENGWTTCSDGRVPAEEEDSEEEDVD